MIWPFKRDPLESDADLLVGAVNTFAISIFPKFIDEFAFIPHDERGLRYWDFVVTIALKLEKKVAACLVRLYPAIARPAFEKCKSFFDKTYYDLSNAGYEPQLVASDTIGGWVVWAILGHPAETEQEFTLARRVGITIVHSFFNWWEKAGDQKPVP